MVKRQVVAAMCVCGISVCELTVLHSRSSFTLLASYPSTPSLRSPAL